MRSAPPYDAISVLALLALAAACVRVPACAQTAAASTAPATQAAANQKPATTAATPAEPAEQATEEKIGADAAADIAKSNKFVTDPAVAGRVAAIGAKIAAIADTTVVTAGFGTSTVYPFKYSYKVIDSKDVNAFSIPGGHIYIYKGLLDLLTSDDELAAVLGHETAHAAHHHVMEMTHQANKMTSQLALGALAAVLAHIPLNDIGNLATGAEYTQAAILNNHFSEEAEEDADHTGMIYMMKAGYNPVGMLAMLQRLKQVEDESPDVELGFLRDHPLTSQRVASARSELASLKVPVTPHSLREASGTMIASEVDQSVAGASPCSEVTIGSKVLFRVASANRLEAVSAADKLNALLDGNLQLYEIKSSGATLIARNQPLIEFTTADLAAQSQTASAAGATPEALASDAAKALRNLLWSQTVLSTTDQEIDVGASKEVMPYP